MVRWWRVGASLAWAAALGLACAPTAAASLATTAALTPTPPMGWSSWYGYKCRISQRLIERSAAAIATNGMYAAGYRYVNVDDCWMSRRRTPSGALQGDVRMFPAGIGALASYVHARREKLGIYLDAGTRTCTGFPGSLGHVTQDVRTLASWGVDAIKLDYCRARPAPAQPVYESYQQAIAASGRAIMLNICEWGYQDPWLWAPGVGSTWRTTGDYYTYGAPKDWWSAIMRLLDLNAGLAPYARPGAFNDPNSLVIGAHVLSIPEERAQMSLWSVLAAPLIAAGDLVHMPRATMQILTNRAVIAVDQDLGGMQGTRVVNTPTQQVWQRTLANGSKVILFLNPTSTAELQSFDLAQIGMTGRYLTRDLWLPRRWNTPGPLYVTVGAHDVRMLELTPAP
jgi:alpha-galactosidase